MATTYISASLKTRIYQADQGRCAYCLTSEQNSGMPLTIDHIQPIAKGGETEFDNLCLACRPCNQYKADLLEAGDPLTGEKAALYHPRSQFWEAHFAWSADGTRVQGLTATGRATIVALQLNRQVIVGARNRWVGGGWHPPQD